MRRCTRLRLIPSRLAASLSTRSPVSEGSTLKVLCLVRLVLRRGWLNFRLRDLGVFGYGFFGLGFVGEGFTPFSPNHCCWLLIRCRPYFLDLRIFFRGLADLEPREGVLRIRGLRYHARRGHCLCRDHRLFCGPRFFLGGFADDGD